MDKIGFLRSVTHVMSENTEQWSKMGEQIKSVFIVPLLNFWNLNPRFGEEPWRQQIKFGLIVPFFNVAITVALVTSTMLFLEVFYAGVVILLVKLSGKKPEQRYKWEALTVTEDLETGNYPMVLVQIPMFNEKQVYQLSIAAVCSFSWPSDRIVIQVLDDSTDPGIKAAVECECHKWAAKGINIVYEARDNRNGYKAGALRDGSNQLYAIGCDYVAIFDADFQPEPDFLQQTVPFLVHNPSLALVQANMTYVNSNECLLTRFQEILQNNHFALEQLVGSSAYSFFSFNGTAGVWRIAAINDAGGWKDRSTVEDMDLSVRVALRGWKFVYLPSIKVKNELPSTFKAYRCQQHRWMSGPANLFRKMFMEILCNQQMALWKRIHVIYSFFFMKKIMASIVALLLTIVLPATVLIPEVQMPNLGAFLMQIYSIYAFVLLVAIGIPRSLPLLPLYILSESVMTLHRSKAILHGLFESNRAKEWVVTEKLGDHTLKAALLAETEVKRTRLRKILERIHVGELGVGAYLLVCGCYAVFLRHAWSSAIYIFAQAFAYSIAGFGCI